MKKSVTVSVVWKHFKVREIDPTKVVCLLCFPQGDDEFDSNIKYLSRGPKIKSFSTKPMWNHLRSMHPFEHECAYNEQQKYLQQQLIQQKKQQQEHLQQKLQKSLAGGSGTSNRKNQKDSLQFFTNMFRNPFLPQAFGDAWNPLLRANFDPTRDERKAEMVSFPGPSEGSVGSAGDNQGTSDDISIPLSPEQFMSEENDPIATGGGGAASCSGPSPISNPPRPESYKLRHNNHLTLVLESLAGDESFMDVTLTAQGKAIKAHKSVLSAVSPYFRSVLKSNPCQHPIIIMPRDIRFEELNSIISYIYRGEMTVAASDLSSLLKTAEILQVTGLSPSETTSGASGIMSQVHGFPAATRIPNFGTNVSHSFSKRHSQKQNQEPILHHQQQEQEQQQQQQQQQQMEQDNDGDEAMNEDTNDSQGRIDPLDFLNTNMTCVKEEVRSDEEVERDDDDGEQNLPGSTSNSSATPNERESESLSPNIQNQLASGSVQNELAGGSVQNQLASGSSIQNELASGSPNPFEDITSKPFNPGESDGTSGENLEESPQQSLTPFGCPYCFEIHRPFEMLQSHLRLKHPTKPSFPCVCGRVYFRISTFADHSKKCKF